MAVFDILSEEKPAKSNTAPPKINMFDILSENKPAEPKRSGMAVLDMLSEDKPSNPQPAYHAIMDILGDSQSGGIRKSRTMDDSLLSR